MNLCGIYSFLKGTNRLSIEPSAIHATRPVTATFERRETKVPFERPEALTAAFTEDPLKQQQWQAYSESIDLVFSGHININAFSNVFQTCWADLIKAAKTVLPCWNVDTQVIWDRFVAFNRSRGNEKVPAGFLLGFMRRWRTAPGTAAQPKEAPTPQRTTDPKERELHDQIKAAPSSNRQFHASDLCRLIGQAAYDARVLDAIRQFGCPRFTATLAVHGRAVLAGEITR